MANEDDSERSPFTRPAFLIAAVVVILIVVTGIVVVAVNLNRHDPSPSAAPSNTASSAPAATHPVAAGGASVCGLEGEVLDGTLTKAPDATWKYQGTTAYPTSNDYGPGKTTSSGVRYCFQHSPEGALFMAANAIAQGSDSAINTEWVDYALAKGQYRDELLSKMGPASSQQGTRLSIGGFRMLSYDGAKATVDLGINGSAQGTTITMSAVYELVWQDGDWKISADTLTPLNMASVPNLSGYTVWGE